MADFKAQVEGLTTLTIGTTPTTTDFETFLADGVKDVTERILRFRPNLAPNFAISTSMSSDSGLDIGGAQVLAVVRENGTAGEYVAAAPIDLSQRFISKDTASLNYRSKFNPGWYEFNGKVYTVPDAGSSGSEAAVTHVAYSTPANSASSVDNFPDKYEPLVVLYAAIKVVDVNASVMTMPDDLSIAIDVPVALEAPSFSADDASLQNDVTEFSKSLSGVAPTYNVNNTRIGISSLEDFLTFSSFATLAPLIYDVEQPLPIPSATLSYDGPISTLVQYSDPTTSKLKDAVSSLTFPTYNKTSFALTDWTFNDKPDFTTGLTAPDPAPLSEYVLDFGALTPPVPWDAESTSDSGDNDEKEGLVWTVFNQALEDDDFDKAAAELTKITQIASLRQDEFTKNMEIYKENVTRISDKHNDVDKTWSMKLARFNADIAKYQADVNNVFTKWTHDMNLESTKYTQINTNAMSLLAQDVSQELNKYNKEKAVFDAQVSAITKDIENSYNLAVKNAELEDELELQNAINAAKKEVDQWQTALKRYELSMNKYTTDVTSNLERYKTDLNKELEGWKNRQVNLLAAHKDDVDEAGKIFEAENAVYQATLQRDMSELTAKVESTVQKMELSTNVDLTNQAQKLQGEIQVYNSKMDKYIAEIQSYEKKVGTQVQEYTTKVQNKQADYTWLREQHDRLKAEYENTFQIMAPQAAPQAQPQGQGR